MVVAKFGNKNRFSRQDIEALPMSLQANWKMLGRNQQKTKLYLYFCFVQMNRNCKHVPERECLASIERSSWRGLWTDLTRRVSLNQFVLHTNNGVSSFDGCCLSYYDVLFPLFSRCRDERAQKLGMVIVQERAMVGEKHFGFGGLQFDECWWRTRRKWARLT